MDNKPSLSVSWEIKFAQLDIGDLFKYYNPDRSYLDKNYIKLSKNCACRLSDNSLKKMKPDYRVVTFVSSQAVSNTVDTFSVSDISWNVKVE